ncbi:MAG: DUF885 family protein [Spirochaetota bacterium]|nr:MAG: DUF885 family protein [Spirochaetota bacterium]
MPASDNIEIVADQLFSHIVECFPVMCGSDEFHFLPRLQHNDNSFAAVDNLDTNQIKDTVSELQTIYRKLESINTEGVLERTIDCELLKICISGILIELEEKKSWRYNPLLYLKTAFIGLEQAIRELPVKKRNTSERVKNRLHAIPKLLKQAEINIRSVPETFHNASLSMIQDCHNYVGILKDLKLYDEFEAHLSKVDEALVSLRSHLVTSVKLGPDYRFNYPSLEITMKQHFQTRNDLKDVFEIGLEESEEARRALVEITREIGTADSWMELYNSYTPIDPESVDVVAMYRQETLSLQEFFQKREFDWVDTSFQLDLVETPAFLNSIRGSASFSASISHRVDNRDLFYITTNKAADSHTTVRLHREYKFLSAHEAFPGHYLLDCVRRSLKNPVRCAIESPLFYEGWAYYAESLLEEDGYIKTPIERLIHNKRTLWRAARCMIDSGLPTGCIDREKAEKLMEEIGYPRDEAAQLVSRFQLNPGYHLCYTLGKNEILNLRGRYGTLLGREEFHRILLEGGELPFHLIERRYKACTGGENS